MQGCCATLRKIALMVGHPVRTETVLPEADAELVHPARQTAGQPREGQDQGVRAIPRIDPPYRQSGEISRDSVRAVLNACWERFQANHPQGSLKSRRSVLESLGRYIGGMPVWKLRPHHALDWLAKRHPRISSTTANTYLTAIIAAMNWAKRVGLIDTNPPAGVPKRRYEVWQEFLPPGLWQ